MRLSVVATAISMSVVGLSAAADVEAAIKRFTDIPAQALAPALRSLAKERNFQIVFATQDVSERRTDGAVGEFTATEALEQLLKGSGLSYRYLDDKTIAILLIGEAAQPRATSPSASILPAEAGNQDTTAKEAQKKSFWDRFRLAQVDQGQTANDRSVGTPESSDNNGRVKVEEIVVTASKRSERLIDVPQSVTVLSTDSLTRVGANQFRDFAEKIPALSYRSSGPALNQISLRGVTVGADVSATVGVYVDDVPYGSSTSFTKAGIISLDSGLFDLDRVEVLKGPQGTLYGSSTMGGLLKYVTKQPDTMRFVGNAQVGISGTQHGGTNYNAAGAVNAPIIDGKLALRATGFETHDDGYIDNVTLNRKDVNSSDIYGGRLDLLYAPTEKLSVRLNGFLQDVKTDGFPLADYRLAGTPVNGPLDQARNIPESFDLYFRVGSGTVKYDLDGSSITSISSYQTSRSSLSADLSALLGGTARTRISPSVTSVRFADAQSTKKFVQEVRFASEGTETLEWVIGGFYTHEKSENHQDFIPQTSSGPVLPNTFFTFFVPSTYEEYAGFGDLTWHMSHKFDVTGGLRYARNNQQFEQVGSGILGRSAPEREFSGHTTTYLANARYHLSDYSTAYLRYATGYRPGGPNFIVTDPTTGLLIGRPTFDPDRLKSYEAGFKAQTTDGRFGIDAAAYYIDWTNIQITVTRGGLSARDNAPGATVRGAELTLTGRPVRALSLMGAFAYQDPKLSQTVTDLGAARGERLSGVPRFATTVSADYQLPWESIRPTVGAAFHYQGDARNGYGATAYRIPSFSTVDLRGGVTLNRVDVQLYVRNLTDERGQFVPRLVLYPAAGPVQVSLIQPRTFGITASMNF
jgi:iron complex outermembrane receptor protein